MLSTDSGSRRRYSGVNGSAPFPPLRYSRFETRGATTDDKTLVVDDPASLNDLKLPEPGVALRAPENDLGRLERERLSASSFSWYTLPLLLLR